MQNSVQNVYNFSQNPLFYAFLLFKTRLCIILVKKITIFYGDKSREKNIKTDQKQEKTLLMFFEKKLDTRQRRKVCMQEKNMIVFENVNNLDLSLTLDCGQSFRWRENPDGSWHGIVRGRSVDVYIKDKKLFICGDVKDGDAAIWQSYFDLNRDYFAVCKKLKEDKWINKAIDAYPGIRILKQDSWEALCSFIISQNNNIPRIKGIIERLCAAFGEDLGDGDFSFPSAERISGLTEQDFVPIRAGFRAKYILDAAKRVAGGETNLEKIKTMSMDSARAELQKIKGVGPKVAECTLLYGFGRVDAFPVDVWVRRIMQELYPDGLPKCTENIEGIAQQYLFHWRRNVENPFEE